jgi:hypothetical protein
MKDLFPGYYPASKEQFLELWQQCIFIFDTNVLLDFYEYRNETRTDFFKVLDAIKHRLWIPHQVALEYHENRSNRIKQAESNFTNIKKILDIEASKILDKETTKTLSHNFKSQYLSPGVVQEIRENVKKVFDTFLDQLASCREDLIQIDGNDYIRDKITDLFQGKIGEPPTNQAELDEIYSEGQQRYEISRPPGFKDQQIKNPDSHYIYKGLVFKRVYGDLILWKQILKQVKSKSLSRIIFITGDNKPDWWRIEDGETIGGRPELVEEISEAGASLFYMYKPERFLEYARKYLQLEVKEKSIQEVEEVSILNNLVEAELQDDLSEQLLPAERYARNILDINMPLSNVARYVTNIERLGRTTNIPTNIERIVAAVKNLPTKADVAKQLPSVRAMQLAQDQYGLINNTLMAGIIAQHDLTALIENQNRLLKQAQTRAIIKQSMPYVNEEINSEDLTDSEASQEVESSED